MPLIEMYVQAGVIDEATKRRLHERVGRQVMEIEGADYEETPLARELTWMFIREQPAGEFSVGGEVLTAEDRPRFFTRISTPQGALDPERRAALVACVHEEVARALGKEPTDLGPLDQWCWIDETNTPSGGGQLVTFEDIMGFLGLDIGGRNPVEIPQWAHDARLGAKA
jgi:phenylpyruvate tautomerase PptA (4-oxalocrotonate tautomerase family)